MSRTRMLLVAVAAAGAMHASCIDPVQSDAIEALGPEARGVEEGELHRPGQPCLTCHYEGGPGDDVFTMAGTVYESRGKPQPAKGVTVTMTDATGKSAETETNRAGNFYVKAKKFSPVYPVRVVIRRGSTKAEMKSRVGGSGSCADCHRGAGDSSHMPAIYLAKASP